MTLNSRELNFRVEAARDGEANLRALCTSLIAFFIELTCRTWYTMACVSCLTDFGTHYELFRVSSFSGRKNRDEKIVIPCKAFFSINLHCKLYGGAAKAIKYRTPVTRVKVLTIFSALFERARSRAPTER